MLTFGMMAPLHVRITKHQKYYPFPFYIEQGRATCSYELMAMAPFRSKEFFPENEHTREHSGAQVSGNHHGFDFFTPGKLTTHTTHTQNS